MELFLKITLAVILLMLAWRLYPAAREQLKNGPKGSGDDWRAVVIPLLLVIGFVFLLIMMVRT
jgi:multisubunit Na+/H+ antiporter MnhB subunit